MCLSFRKINSCDERRGGPAGQLSGASAHKGVSDVTGKFVSMSAVNSGFLTLLLTNLAKCKLAPLPQKFTAPPVDLKFAERCALCTQRLLKDNNVHKDLIYLQSRPTHFYEYVY